MKSKLYKHYRKPSYFQLRKIGYVSLSVTILMMSIVIPLSLISVGAYQPSVSSSITSSEITSSETTEDEDEPSSISNDIFLTIENQALERTTLWK
jgi:hypothetical protein